MCLLDLYCFAPTHNLVICIFTFISNFLKFDIILTEMQMEVQSLNSEFLCLKELPVIEKSEFLKIKSQSYFLGTGNFVLL